MAMADLTDAFADLGIAMPTTQEAFRALVESTDKDSPLWRALIELAPAFHNLVPAVEEVVETVDEAADQIQAVWTTMAPAISEKSERIRKRLEEEKRMQDELARLEDDRAGLRDWALGKRLDDSASSLTAQDRYALAMDEYQRVVADGDIKGFQSISDTLFGLGRDLFGSSGDYKALEEMILGDAERLGKFDLPEVGESLASILDENKQLRVKMEELISKLIETSARQVDAIQSSSDKMTRTLTNAVGAAR